MNKFTEEILLLVKDLGTAIDEFVSTPYGKLRVNTIPRSTVYHALDRLVQKGLITKKRTGVKNYYYLTDKGKAAVKAKSKLIERNDGMSTLIIFDIPEKYSKERVALRRYLLRNKYILLQKSVLIGRYKVSSELLSVIEELRLKKFITFVSARIDPHFQ